MRPAVKPGDFPPAETWPNKPDEYPYSICARWPNDLLSHWERILFNEYRQKHIDGDAKGKRAARAFWGRIQSCQPLGELCVCSPRHAHIVIVLFDIWDLFQKENVTSFFNLEGDQAGTRKCRQAERTKEQRYWRVVRGRVEELTAQAESLPDPIVTPEERDTLLQVLQEARRRASEFSQEPPPRTLKYVLHFSSLGPVADKAVDLVTRYDKIGAGRPLRDGANVDLFLSLLTDFLREACGGRGHWTLALQLFKHFIPKQTLFAPAYTGENLRGRVNQFAGLSGNREIIKERKNFFLKCILPPSWPFREFLVNSPR